MIAAPTPDFLFIVAVVAVSSAFGVYMAARREPKLICPPLDEDEEIAMADAFRSSDARVPLEVARANRDAVLEEVTSENANWTADAILTFQALPSGEVGTGEDIRAKLIQAGLRLPRHPNVWGAFFNTLARRGMIVPTGEYRPMRAKSSNGRKTGVYFKPERAAA